MIEKMAAFAPIPSAQDTIATNDSSGDDLRERIREGL